jgi:hypothetical protein
MHGWIWLWLLFMFMMFVAPTGYGWGVRGWGPPYPSYLRRRSNATANPNAHHWGVGADLVWLALFFAFMWFVVGFAWWRTW